MKTLALFLVFSLFSSNPLLAKDSSEMLVIGGVDVGNGYIVNSGFEITDEFLSQEAVIEHFNSLKGPISSGKNPKVERLIRLGGCSKGRIKVQKLQFKSYYPSSEGKLLKKRYKGFVSLGLFNCKRPNVVASNKK